MTQTDIIAELIVKYLKSEKQNGKEYIDLTARQVGKMAGLTNRTPMCINAMKQAAEHFKYEVIRDVPSGQSTTVEFRYYLQ